jgi:hypothetical protein
MKNTIDRDECPKCMDWYHNDLDSCPDCGFDFSLLASETIFSDKDDGETRAKERCDDTINDNEQTAEYELLKTSIEKLKQLVDDDLITKEQYEDGVLKITKENTPIDLSLDGVHSYLTLIKDLERESLIDSDMYKKISDPILTDLNYDVALKHTNVSNDPNTFKEDIKGNDFKEAPVEEVAETLISDASGEKSLIKPVLLTTAFMIPVALLIGILKESMSPGFPRAIIIIVCFLSIYKFWRWVKG